MFDIPYTCLESLGLLARWQLAASAPKSEKNQNGWLFNAYNGKNAVGVQVTAATHNIISVTFQETCVSWTWQSGRNSNESDKCNELELHVDDFSIQIN